MTLINENYNKFLVCYTIEEKEYKEKKKSASPQIDFSSLIIPHKNDDINQILVQYKDVATKIKKDKMPLFIVIPPSFLYDYIKLFNHNNFDNLVLTAQLIDYIKIFNPKINEIQKKANKAIHETGLSLISNKSITNMQLLYFIEYTHYYNPKFFKSNIHLLDSLNISLIDKEFLEKCQEVNWLDIFGDSYFKFVDELSSLINNNNDFNKLIKILKINKTKISKGFIKSFSSILEEKYFSVYKYSYGKEPCPNIIDDTEALLYFIDNHKLNVEDFISEINKIFSDDLFYEIYKKLLENHNDLSAKFENAIVYFLLSKKKYNTNIDLLTLLINKCNHSKGQIVFFIEIHYYIKENEIFSLEETPSIKLFRNILEYNYFSQKEKELNKYYNYHVKLLSDIKGKITRKEINYKDINKFFLNKDNQRILSERLLIINIMNNSGKKKDIQLLTESVYHINNIIKDLYILIEDLNFFYKNSKINEIEKINNLIETIKTSNLNVTENNPEIKEYLKLIKGKEFNERVLKRNSLIFMEIYKKERELNKYDDYKCLEESNNKFNEFKDFFKDKDANKIGIEILKVIQSMKLNAESLNQEIAKLFEIFDYHDDKQKISNIMISLFYKEKILKVVYSLKDIIEITKVKKGYFYNLLNVIISNLENYNSLIILKLVNTLLNVYSINIYDENDTFIQLLINIPDFQDIIQFYDDLTEDKKEKLREKQTFLILEKIMNIFEDKRKMSKIKDKDLVQTINDELTKMTISSSDNNQIFKEFDDLIQIEMINI